MNGGVFRPAQEGTLRQVSPVEHA